MITITCRELIEFLDAYVADELPPERRQEFDRHLALCPSCIAYLHSYRETIRLTRTTAADALDDLPPDVIAAILAATRRPE